VPQNQGSGTNASFMTVTQNQVEDPFLTEIEFIMKDGSTRTIQRTERLLGKGGQGCVYLGKDKEDPKKVYAIKITDLSGCPDQYMD